MDRVLLKTGEREVDEGTLFQFEKGYLWEVALGLAFGQKAAIRWGEVELDGIIGSPDGVRTILEYVNNAHVVKDTILEEYKCTALSPEHTPATNWKWLMQTKGYCKMLGVRKCIFRVLHHVSIMYEPGEAYQPYELVFTQGELDENWQAILNHKKVMEARA